MRGPRGLEDRSKVPLKPLCYQLSGCKGICATVCSSGYLCRKAPRLRFRADTLARPHRPFRQKVKVLFWQWGGWSLEEGCRVLSLRRESTYSLQDYVLSPQAQRKSSTGKRRKTPVLDRQATGLKAPDYTAQRPSTRGASRHPSPRPLAPAVARDRSGRKRPHLRRVTGRRGRFIITGHKGLTFFLSRKFFTDEGHYRRHQALMYVQIFSLNLRVRTVSPIMIIV